MGVTLVGKTEYKVANFEIVEKFGEIKKINKLTIPKSKYEALKSEDVLSLYVDGILQGKYIVDEIFIGRNSVEVRLYDYIAKLVRDYDLFNIGGDYRVEYDNTSAATILDDILSGTIFSRGYAPSQLITVRGEYENRVKWIEGIAKACLYGYDSNGVVTTNYPSIVEVIDHCTWWTDFRSNKVYIGVSGAIRSGDYWTPLEIDITDYILDLSEINERLIKYNKIIVLGYGDGINQVVGTAGSGAPVSVFVDRRITKQETAQRKAEAILASQKQPKSLRVKVNPDLYFSGAIRLGSNVSISYPVEAKGTYRVMAIRASYDEVELELESGADVRFSSEFADIKKALEISNVYLQGATNVSNFGGWQTALSPTHPAVYRFFLPDSSVGFIRVNEAYVNVYGHAYRIWSRGVAAGNTGEDANWGAVASSSGWTVWRPGDIPYEEWVTLFTYTPSSLQKDPYFVFVEIVVKAQELNSDGTSWCSWQARLRNTNTNTTWTSADFIHTSAEFGLTQTCTSTIIAFSPGSRNDTYAVDFRFWQIPDRAHVWAKMYFVSRHDHGTHTHPIETGIFETSDYPSNVEVWLYNSLYTSGVKVADPTTHSILSGGMEFSATKIDIKDYVQPGENVIKVTSDTLGMVQVDGFYRIFIKTK